MKSQAPPAQRTALIEIAGRDSMAAGLLAAKSGRYDVMVPTIVYTGSEYGDWKAEVENARALAAHLRDVHGINAPIEPVALGSPRWFHAVSGRFLSELYGLYGFSGTCVACHMYCHAVRVPLAKEVGAGAVISGERLEHDGHLKINQLSPVLDAYAEVLSGSGIKLDSPLVNLSRGEDIQEIVSTAPGISDGDSFQTGCVLSSNYRDLEGRINYAEERLDSYLRQFLVPATVRILELISTGVEPVDYVGIAGEIISERKHIEGTADCS